MSVACASAAGLLACYVLLTWLTGNWIQGSLGPDFVPMAPSTACLTVLLSIAVIVRRVSRRRDGGRFIVSVAVTAIAVTALLSWTRQFLAAYCPVTETWLNAAMVRVMGASFDSLSPLTLTVLVITALALLLDMVPRNAGLPWRYAGPFAASAALVIAFVVVVSYAVGTPLLYGTRTPPMALPTALCMALLNVSVSLEAHADMWTVSSPFPGQAPDPPGMKQYTPAFAVLFLFLVAFMIVLGTLYLREQESAMRLMAQDRLEDVADAQIVQIANWQTERMEDAKAFTEAPFVADDLRELLSGPESEGLRARVAGWLSVFKAGSSYEQITVYDSNFIPRAGTSEKNPMPEAEFRQALATAFRERRVFMTDFCFGEGGDVYIDFLVPTGFRNVQSPAVQPDPVAVAVFRVDGRRLISPLSRTLSMTDPTTEILLVCGRDRDILPLSEIPSETQALRAACQPVKPSDAAGTMALKGEAGIAEGPDCRGVPVVAAVRPIPGTTWSIVVKMDNTVIYAPARHQVLQAAVIIFLLILAAGLSVGVLWRQRNISFYREALDLERERGTLAQRFEHLMKHANDIILLASQDGTIREANDRAVQAYGASPAEMRKMKLPELCAPSSRAEALCRTEELKASGGTLFQSVHMRADGSTFPVEISASVVGIGGESCLMAMVRDISERERAAEALRASEQNFRALFDSIHDLLFVVDLNGNILRVNETVISRLGYPEAELAGSSLLLLHQKERREEAARILEDMAAGKTDYCPVPLVTRDGGIIPVETHIVTGVWSGQRVLFGISRDISALRRSEEKFARVFQNNPLLMAISTIDEGRYLEVNEAFFHTLGYSKEEVVGATSLELGVFVEPGQRGIIKKTVLETGALRNFETTVRAKDGQIRTGLFSVDLVQVQNRDFLLTVMNDVTDRKRVEEALLLVRKAVDSTSEAIGMSDPAGVHFYQNQAFTGLFGYTTGEMCAAGGPVAVYEDARIAREVFDTIMRGRSWKGEAMMVSRTGRHFPVTLSADAIRDEQGNIIGLIGVHTDISESKRIAEERQRLLEQTQRDARTKAELLAEVNHRVKNNLTSILGLLLGEKQFVPARDRALVAPVLDSLALRIRGLLQVHQMLSDAHWSPMRLNDLAERVIRAALVAVPRGRQVSVTLRASAVQISPRQAGSLALVLNELAVNTAKHALQQRDEACIIVGVSMEGATIRLEYRDDGPGYPEAVLKGGAGGVGLNLVRQLVCETLRGTLNLSNEDGAVAVLCIKTENPRQT